MELPPDQQLSLHFKLSEFTRSDTASRLGIDNFHPSEEIIGRLKGLAQALENIRAELNRPLILTSGWRCSALNGVTPGSSPTSAHPLGYAADCHTSGLTPFELCNFVAHLPGLRFDQIIYEYGSWMHLSIDPRARRMLLTKKSGQAGYLEGLVP